MARTRQRVYILAMLEIKTFTGAGFGENAYLVRKKNSSDIIALDPGADASAMVRELESLDLNLAAILLTHAHLDHIEGVAALKRYANAPLYLHPDDRLFYENAQLQAAQFGMHVETLPSIDHWLQSGQRVTAGGITFEVRHVPVTAPATSFSTLQLPVSRSLAMLFFRDRSAGPICPVVTTSS